MSNLIIWANQATVDYNYRVQKDIARIAHQILDRKLLSTPPDHKDAIEIKEVLKQAQTEQLENHCYLSQ